MPDIAHPFKYSAHEKQLIGKKMEDPNFSHTSWSEDDLAELRAAIRKHYRSEQNGMCAYCKNPVSLSSALNCHVEHIAPKSVHRDFIFEEKNMCVICADCNQIKRNQETSSSVFETIANAPTRKVYPRSSGAFLIVHPHFDNWHDHIEKFGNYYCDKSKKGWFTIGACALNRKLRNFGWEPSIIDDKKARDSMHLYLDAKDPKEKTQALRRLMELLI